ncbi:hypothetical protein quinque_004165 [Culex quinquefasciatus]
MAQMAITLLTRAIEYDINGRKLESLKLYEDGIEALLKESKAEVDPKRKQHFQSKILEYMARAEQVKEQITRWRSRGEIRDKIHVVEGATGYSYGRVFGKYMTDEVKEIMIEEPYVREHHQLCNVVMFCELAVSSCKALKFVKLMTVREKKNNDEQARALQILKDSVKKQVWNSLWSTRSTCMIGKLSKVDVIFGWFRAVNVRSVERLIRVVMLHDKIPYGVIVLRLGYTVLDVDRPCHPNTNCKR